MGSHEKVVLVLGSLDWLAAYCILNSKCPAISRKSNPDIQLYLK